MTDDNINQNNNLVEENKNLRIEASLLTDAYFQLKTITNKLEKNEIETRKNERLLSSIVDNIPDMIFVKDTNDLKFVRLNKAGEELLGYSNKDMVGKSDYDFFNAEVAERFTSKDREVVNGKKLFDIPEEKINTKLKGERILHTKKITILDDNGEPVYLLGISEDITERKLEEEKLKESEERFRYSFEYAVNGACFAGIDGKFIRTNIAFKKMMGYTEEEIIKLKFNDITYPDDIPIGVNFLKRILSGEIEGASFEKRYIRKDGNIIWVAISVSLIKINSKPAYFATQTVDITENKKIEEKLIESEDKYKTLIETSPDCIKIFDLKGKLLFINESGKKEHFLKSPEEVKNFNALETIVEEDRYKFTKALQDVSEGKSSIIEIRHTKEGANRDICQETLVPVKNDKGDITGAFAISRDLTEMRKSEQAFKNKYKEMEQLYKLTIGRELKMVALKKEIEELKAKSENK